MRRSGASSHGKASVIWRTIHSAVGLAVTLISRRRSCLRMAKTEQSKAHRRHDQEVHSRNACGMVLQEGLPGLRPPSPTPRHVLGDRRLSDLNPELEQFAMDAGRSPQPIGQAHLSDQATDLAGYPRSTATRARLPAPVQSEAHPMPPKYGLRLDR